MTCAGCVARVEKALKNVEGVASASVNFATEKATIAFDSPVADVQRLQDAVAGAGYVLVLPREEKANRTTASRSEGSASLKRDLVFSVVLSFPIVLLSMAGMTEWYVRRVPISMEMTDRILLLLATPLVFISGGRFFRGCWSAAKRFTADMNTLVAVGTGSAYAYSTVAVLFPALLGTAASAPHVYFDTTATIITLVVLGKFLEMRAKRQASDAIRNLMGLQPKTACVVRNNVEIDVPLDDVMLNDRVVIRPGERIPVDGVITKGFTTIDEAMVTGESLPVEKHEADKVIGGSINKNGSIEFRATAVGKNTLLAHIVRLVEDAQGSKAPIQSLADRIAAVFVPTVIGIAVVTFLLWFFVGGIGFTHSLVNFIAVLIIACRAPWTRDADGNHGRNGNRSEARHSDQECRKSRTNSQDPDNRS